MVNVEMVKGTGKTSGNNMEARWQSIAIRL